MSLKIPEDMIDKERTAAAGAAAVVSIRDMLVLLGASDQELKDSDDRAEILAREPWRKDGLWFESLGSFENGVEHGFMRGQIDWSGTRFAKTE